MCLVSIALKGAVALKGAGAAAVHSAAVATVHHCGVEFSTAASLLVP